MAQRETNALRSAVEDCLAELPGMLDMTLCDFLAPCALSIEAAHTVAGPIGMLTLHEVSAFLTNSSMSDGEDAESALLIEHLDTVLDGIDEAERVARGNLLLLFAVYAGCGVRNA